MYVQANSLFKTTNSNSFIVCYRHNPCSVKKASYLLVSFVTLNSFLYYSYCIKLNVSIKSSTAQNA